MENFGPDVEGKYNEVQHKSDLFKQILKGTTKVILYLISWFIFVFVLGFFLSYLGDWIPYSTIVLVLWIIGFLIILITALVKLNNLIKSYYISHDPSQPQSLPKRIFTGISKSIVRIFIALAAWYLLPQLALMSGLPWLHYLLSYGIPAILVILAISHFTKSIKVEDSYQVEQLGSSLKEKIFRSLVLFIFGLISLFGGLLFLTGGGWDFLIYGPFAIIFSFIFIIGQINLIGKIKASYFTIFSVAFLNIATLLSFRINIPVMTDGHGIYWPSYFFGSFGYQNLKDFEHPLGGILLILTAVYFIGGFYLLFSRPFKNRTWNEIIVIGIGITLLTAHAFPVLQKYPYLLKGRENVEILNAYETTFIAREFSYIYPKNQKLNSSCPYARNYYDKLKSIEKVNESYTITCKKEIATWTDMAAANPATRIVNIPYTITIPEYESGKPQYRGQLHIPLRTRQESSTGYPSDVEMVYKPGDVLVITVKVSPALIVYLDVPGNDKVSSRGSEVFIPQHTSEATLALFYPIDTPKASEGKDVEWAYIIFDPTFGERSGTVLEVALISQE
ncbi:MAG: hypothetical protein AAB706_02570 [Patescibacteria group bacterium]